MNDTSIACFLSVARTGSFTTSAHELFGTQQAVSRNIQSLEEELGVTLLDRSGRTVALTREGTRFLQWCEEYDRQLNRTINAARRLMGDSSNLLHFGWTDWTGCPESVSAGISAFSGSYPDCTVDFLQGSVGEIKTFLREGLLDLAVMPEVCTYDMADFSVSAPFLRLPLYAVTGKSNVFNVPEPGVAELVAMKQLTARFENESDGEIRERTMQFCTRAGIYPEHLEIMPNVYSVYSELLCGPCYTIAPYTDFAARRGSLQFIPLEATLPLVFVRQRDVTTPWSPLLEASLQGRGDDR